MKVLIILPNTLFEDIYKDIISLDISKVFLVKDGFYINNKQHKQKLVLMLSAMREYKLYLESKDIKYKCVDSADDIKLNSEADFYMYEPLDKKIRTKYKKIFKNVIYIKNRSIILSLSEVKEIKNSYKSTSSAGFRHNEFYKIMRKRLKILTDEKGNPEFGKWSYDSLNRKPFTKEYKEMDIYVNNTTSVKKSIEEVYSDDSLSKAFGECKKLYYPTTFKSCKKQFNSFLAYKLERFGEFQDAISSEVVFGEHSNISAVMNIGLLTPEYVINKILKYYYSGNNAFRKKYINSVEGFIRQIIGWREYMRFVYEISGNALTNDSYLKTIQDSKVVSIHSSWYSGTTGIPIFDKTIQKILQTGYAHHIERLMILNNAMIMYGFSRKEIHKWFMAMFVDSYEWVMLGCVSMNHNSLSRDFKYMTRVYLAGDNYIKKMSNYRDNISMDVFKHLFKTFIQQHKNILRRDYNLAGYIARLK